MKQLLKRSSTSQRLVIFVQNATSTTGGGLTGVAYNASGLKWYWYTDVNGTSSSVTIVQGTVGTFTSGGWVELDSTNMPGFYEIGVPDACWASSANWTVMELFGAANMVPVTVEVELTGVDFRNANNAGINALPSIAPSQTGGIPVVGTNSGNIDLDSAGRVDVSKWLGTAVTSNAGTPVVFTTNTVTASVVGTPGVNVTQWNGAAVAVPIVSGVPKVDVADWLGTAVTSHSGVPVVYATDGTTTAVGTPAVNVVEWLGTAVTSHAGTPITYAADGTTTANGGIGTFTATVPTLSTNVNVAKWNGSVIVTPNVTGVPVVDVADWLGTAVTSNAGVPLVDVSSVTGTVTATVVGGTITTVSGNVVGTVGSVTSPVSISTGQLTVRKDQALSGFTFPMYNSTTGQPATGLTVLCSISIDGGALTASTNAPAEVGSGIYKLNLAAADLNGTVITLVFVASSASATIVTLITQS